MTSARMISQIMQQRFRRFGHGTWNLRNLFGNQRNHRNGQALVELAVFGSILLAALGFLLRVGMKMNYDQEIRMATFRRALAAAHADNGTDQDAMAVLYYYMSDRQMPDPGDGMMSLPRARAESTAFVEWGDRLTYAAGHLRATQPLVAVRLNGTEQEFRMEDLPHNGLTYQDDGNVVVGQVAFRSLAREAGTTNIGWETLAQSGGGSSTGSTTTTNSWVDVNTVSGDRVSSSLTSGASGLGP